MDGPPVRGAGVPTLGQMGTIVKKTCVLKFGRTVPQWRKDWELKFGKIHLPVMMEGGTKI